jgi:hypothetical protein
MVARGGFTTPHFSNARRAHRRYSSLLNGSSEQQCRSRGNPER